MACPDDTPETVRAIFRLSHELEMSQPFFIPLTPLPGTPFWRDELWDDTGESFRDYNFLPSTTRPGARRDLEWALLTAFRRNGRPRVSAPTGAACSTPMRAAAG